MKYTRPWICLNIRLYTGILHLKHMHACNAECMCYNYIIMGVQSLYYLLLHAFSQNQLGYHLETPISAPKDDIGRKMIHVPGSCHKLFITYFVQNLFWLMHKFSLTWNKIFPLCLHLRHKYILVVEIARINDTLAVQLKTAISVTSYALVSAMRA